MVTRLCTCTNFGTALFWLVDRKRGTLTRHVECRYCRQPHPQGTSETQMRRERQALAEGFLFSQNLPNGFTKEYVKNLEYGFLKRYLKKDMLLEYGLAKLPINQSR